MRKNDFEDFAGTSGGRRAATLLLTHAVKPDEIFAIVLAEVTQNLPHLEEGGRYTTEDLCGPDIWSEWRAADKRVDDKRVDDKRVAEHRVAGMCLAYLVRNEVVKLFRHWTRSGKGTAKYRTTPAPELLASQRIRIVRPRSTGYVRGESAGSMT